MEASLHVILSKIKSKNAADLTDAFHRMEGSYLRWAKTGHEVGSWWFAFCCVGFCEVLDVDV